MLPRFVTKLTRFVMLKRFVIKSLGFVIPDAICNKKAAEFCNKISMRFVIKKLPHFVIKNFITKFFYYKTR